MRSGTIHVILPRRYDTVYCQERSSSIDDFMSSSGKRKVGGGGGGGGGGTLFSYFKPKQAATKSTKEPGSVTRTPNVQEKDGSEGKVAAVANGHATPQRRKKEERENIEPMDVTPCTHQQTAVDEDSEEEIGVRKVC